MNAARLGKMISKLRKKHGMTQSELAAKLRITDKAVSKWESGAGYPEITQLPVLSGIFGVSIDYLLKGNSRGIVVAGSILADEVNMVDHYPEKGSLANILSCENVIGGCVPLTIIPLAKLDSELFLTALGKIGDDERGRFVITQLKKYGIDTGKIRISSDKPTSYTVMMTERKGAPNTCFHVRGANAAFGIEDIDIDGLDCEIFHVGYAMLLDELDREDAEYGTKMARLLHSLNQRGIKTSVDVTDVERRENFAQKIIPALKYCNYAIVNETECGLVAGLPPRDEDGALRTENIRESMERFMQYGVQDRVIVTAREAGFLLNADGTFLTLPMPENLIRDTVGGEEAYTAGCLYGIYSGYDDLHILEFASAVSRCQPGRELVGRVRSKEQIDEIILKYKAKTQEE